MAERSESKHQFFISYSRRDIEFVRRLASDLERAGYDAWWDITELQGGETWVRAISDAIEASEYFIVVLSPNSVESEWVRKEYTQALGLRMKVIPILLERTEIPFALNAINYIDFTTGDYQRSFNILLSALGIAGRTQAVKPVKAAKTRNTIKASGNIDMVEDVVPGDNSVAGKAGPPAEEEQADGQAEALPVQLVEVAKLFSVSTDQSSGDDKLNYEQFARAFATLVQNPEAATPFTIGIYGQWGSGKSFLMKQIIKSLRSGEVTSARTLRERIAVFLARLRRRKTRPVDTIIIEFNAWVYSGSEHLWASLVTHLYREIERYFGIGAHAQRLGKALQRSLPRTAGIFAFYAVLGLIASLVIDFSSLRTAWDETRLAVSAVGVSLIGGSVLASLPVLWSALRDFADTLFLSRAMNLQKLAARPDFRDQIGIMAEIKSEIGFISHLLERRNKRQQTRVVLFIDDLDRCEHRKALEVLQAIMLLLADHDGSPFVIFLGIDARVMVRAVEEHYGAVLVKAGINGYEYLDKIVQVPFVIPSANREDIGKYVDSLIWTQAEKELVAAKFPPKTDGAAAGTPGPAGAEPGGSGPASAEKDTPRVQMESVPVTFTKPEREALMACVEDMVDNPRKIKRIVNIYRLVRLLLPAGFQDYPKIIRWIVLTEQWPLHASWILEEIENDFFLNGKLSRRESATIVEVYQQVKDYIYSDDMDPLMAVDADPILFSHYLRKEPVFTVREVYRLLYPLTFNLNPAIKSEIAKYTARMAENFIETKASRTARSRKNGASAGETKSATVEKAVKAVTNPEMKS